MDGGRINVPLRTSNISGKKMRKRRELDALVAANGLKRYSGYNGGPVCVKPGTNYHDQLLSESTDEQEDYSRTRNKAALKRSRSGVYRKRCSVILNSVTLILITGCVVITATMLFMFSSLRDQAHFLRNEVNEVIAGNQGIPESLQKCHLQIKELQKNQSDLYARFISLNKKFINLTFEIEDLSSLREGLNLTTESSNIDVNLKKISENILLFKNWLEEMNNTVAQLSVSENRLEEDFHHFQLNISNLKEKLLLERVPNSSISAIDAQRKDDQKITSLVDALTEKVTYLNNSLNSEIQLVKELQVQDHKILQTLNESFSQSRNTWQNGLFHVSQMSSDMQNLTDQVNASNKKFKILSEKVDKLIKNSSVSVAQSNDSKIAV